MDIQGCRYFDYSATYSAERKMKILKLLKFLMFFFIQHIFFYSTQMVSGVFTVQCTKSDTLCRTKLWVGYITQAGNLFSCYMAINHWYIVVCKNICFYDMWEQSVHRPTCASTHWYVLHKSLCFTLFIFTRNHITYWTN